MVITAGRPREKVLKSRRDRTKRSGAGIHADGDEPMSAAVARALKSGGLWLTLAYVALMALLARAYA